jgi:hypothetical protein
MFAGRLIVAKSTLLDVRLDSRHGIGRTSRIMMTTEMIGASRAPIVPTIFRENYIGRNEVLVQEFPWCARSWNANSLRAESPNLDRTIDLSPRRTPFSSASDGRAEVSQFRSQDRETKRRPAPASRSLDLENSLRDDAYGGGQRPNTCASFVSADT